MVTRVLKLLVIRRGRFIFPVFMLSVLTLVMSGCRDWLNLVPENDLILEEYWQTEQQALSELGACYMAFTYDASTYYGDHPEKNDYELSKGIIQRLILASEARSENLTPYLSADYEIDAISEGDLTSHNYLTSWEDFYRAINYCNIFLHFGKDAVEKDADFTIGELKSMNAEAIALRSLAYFNLVKLYKDVPYVTEATLTDQQEFEVAKTSGDSIIGVLINDLEAALIDAPSSFLLMADMKGRFTKNGIHALLADIYLWDEQYDMCISHCNAIINSGSFELVDGESALYDIFYRGNSKESIFEFQFGETDAGYQFNWAVNWMYGGNGNFAPALRVSACLDKSITDSPFNEGNADGRMENDLRYSDYIVNTNNGGIKRVFKYSGLRRTDLGNGSSSYTYRSNSANWIMYRYADILLMKAEALVQVIKEEDGGSLGMGSPEVAEAFRLVNTTFLRSNPDLGTDSLQIGKFNDIRSLESLVLRERHREFMFEGKRWFDLMRAAKRADNPKVLTGKVAAKYNGNGNLLFLSTTNMDALYLPINKGELDANPNLEQNEYYERLENDLKN